MVKSYNNVICMKIWQVGALISGSPIIKLDIEKAKSMEFMEIDLQGGFISAIQELVKYLYHEEIQFIRLKHFAICTRSILMNDQLLTLYLITNQKKLSLKYAFYRLNRLAENLKPLDQSFSSIHRDKNKFLESYFKDEFLNKNIPVTDLIKIFFKRYDL